MSSEPNNGLWKRKADTALRHCKTVKAFLDETLDVIPDSVLDSIPKETPSCCEHAFADLDSLLPSPYISRREELLYV
ncbi:hypothetical protein Scep_004405 [Stephania cephalantha]|uniref:Uncharacterized protein n=1 Tax=Stephania cephalantha TaxID=152367 RepID=A0AAP0KSK1_9MAGN